MRKAIFVAVVLFALLSVMTYVSATTLQIDNLEVTIDGADAKPYNINGHDVAGETISGIEAGETIPVQVTFEARENASNAKVKVWIEGNRDEISEKTAIFQLVNGSTYSKKLSLKVPSNIDETEKYTLWISISAKTKKYETSYDLRLQRQSYKVEVLSAEAPQTATAGSNIAVDVVLKNRGWHDLEDVFAIVRIPDLKVEKKVYFGDIAEEDNEHDEDAVERRVYLTLPSDAKTGTYNIEVEAYNIDSANTVKKTIAITEVSESASDVLVGTSSKTISIGQETTYELVIVNPTSKMKVYALAPESVKGLIVDVEPIVTVPADSSKTIRVNVRAAENAEEGTNSIAINIESEGKPVKRVTFTANVEAKAKAVGSIVVLTVVLAIVFVVLLIVLIALLTRKPAMRETEESSYY